MLLTCKFVAFLFKLLFLKKKFCSILYPFIGSFATDRRRIRNNPVSDPEDPESDIPGPSTLPATLAPTAVNPLPGNANANAPPATLIANPNNTAALIPGNLSAAQLAFLQAYNNPQNKRQTKKTKKKSKKSKKSKSKAKSSSSSSSDSLSSNSSSSSSDDDESSNWSYLRYIWPVEKRPVGLQNKTAFNALSLDNLLHLARFDRENLKSIEGDLSSSFNPDTKPKTTTFKKARDNGFKKLHSARWQRYPLADIKDWWKFMPKTRPHLYKNLDLKFMGGNNKLTQKTLQGLHDRTKCLTFKMFLSANVNVANKPVKKIEKREDEGIVSTLDYAWENPTSLSQISDGLLNYSTALMHVWPYDPTAIILMRIINKYNFASAAPTMAERLSVLTAFFNLVLRENATRAVRKDVIMSHEEQEESFKSILVSSGYNSAVPTFTRIPRVDSDGSTKPRFTPPSRSAPLTQNKPRINVVMHHGSPICFNFNTGSCRNPTSSVGCRDAKSGKDFAHACNKWVMAKNAHCFARHPRIQHI